MSEPVYCECGTACTDGADLAEHINQSDSEDCAPANGQPEEAFNESMTDETDDNDQKSTGSADSAEPSGLSVTWVSRDRHVVFSSHEQGDSHAYVVELDADGGPSCTCKHGEIYEGGSEACKHIQKAVENHHGRPNLGHAIDLECASIVADLHSTLQAVESGGVQHSGGNTAGDSSGLQKDSGGSDGNQDNTGDDSDGVVTEIDPTPEQEGLCDDIMHWIEQAADFNDDIDPDAVECVWVDADGTQGVKIDDAPFYPDDGRYYDDGEWQDKEAWDDASDALSELIKMQDEREWFGEPDYCWVIPEEKVSEVTG